MAQAPEQQGGQRLKYTITHHRKAEHTHEAFIKWLTEEHLPLAMPVFKKHGLIEYSLFVTPPALNGAVAQQMEKLRPTWDVADFDCVIEYTIPGMQAVADLMADPEWRVAVKDEEYWVDTTKALVSLGYCTPYLLETGEVVNLRE